VLKVSSYICLFFILTITTCQASDFTGMWWDTSKPGTGVFLDYIEDSNGICGSWYLYDERGTPQWVTFIGTVTNNTLNTSLYRFTGPSFGGAWDNSIVRGEAVGTISIDFSNPQTLTMDYEIERQRGILKLTRFSTQTCPGSIWWDISKQGQGIVHFHFLDSSGKEQLGLVWYVYDMEGNNIWYTATASPGNSSYDVWQFVGPSLGDKWDLALLQSEKVGIITGNFDNSIQNGEKHSVRLDFDIKSTKGVLSLEPFLCPIATP